MRLIILVLTTLLVISAANNKDNKSLNTILAEIREHPFGKAVSAMMEIQSRTTAPSERVQEINDFLQDLRSRINEQNVREKAKFDEKDAFCTETLGKLTNDIATYNAQLAAARTERDDLNQEQNEKLESNQQELANFDQMQSDKAKALQDQQTDNESFEINNGNYNSLIIACEEGIRLIKHMIHGQIPSRAFVQIHELKNNLKDTNEKLKTVKIAAYLQPVIMSLTALSTQTSINFEDVLKIIELLEKILANLKNEQVLNQQRHERTQNDLETLINNLSDWISSSSKIIEIYKRRLEEIQERVGQLNKEIQETQELLSKTNDFFTQTKGECDSAKELFLLGLNKREREISILEKLIAYFEANIHGQQ